MEQENSIGSFSYHYIKALQQYQLKVAEAKSLAFQEKLLLTQSESDCFFQIPTQQLKLGLNVNRVISATAIRIMHLKNCCYCLMTTARPMTPSSLIIAAIVYSEQRTKPFALGIFNKTKVKLNNPYFTPQQREHIPIIFVSHRNVSPLNKSQTMPKRTSQDLRQQANTYFKTKRYLEAIHLYQMALAHIYWPDIRQQSVLYSNAAACLFQLRLYQSCIMLSDLAVLLDPSYNKGYYRKIRSLLQLHQFTEITPPLIKISTLISKPQFQLLNQKYTEVVSQDSGIFNWGAIINGTCSQGEFFSPKLKLVRVEGDTRVVVQQTIEQFQTILVNRPLIYVQQNGRNFKQSFMDFLKQIQNYSLCDQGFQQGVYLLPCECHPLLSQREQSYHQLKKSVKNLPMKELFSKLQRSVFQQRSLEKAQHMNGYGIWKEMFYFQHKCTPNCSTIHINGYLVVSALQKLQQGQILSLDLISEVQPSRRSESMRIKLDQQCSCQMCEGREFSGNFTSIEQLYDEIQMMTNARRKKQYIWSILEQQWQEKFTLLDQDAIQLIYYYVFYVEKECEWDDLHNLIRARTKYFQKQFQEHLQEVTTKYLSSYFKLGKEDSQKIYESLLKKATT